MQQTRMHVSLAPLDPVGGEGSEKQDELERVDVAVHGGSARLEREDRGLPEADRDERRGRAEPASGALTPLDYRFSLGTLLMVIGSGVVASSSLPGWVSGGVLMVVGILICRNN